MKNCLSCSLQTYYGSFRFFSYQFQIINLYCVQQLYILFSLVLSRQGIQCSLLLLIDAVYTTYTHYRLIFCTVFYQALLYSICCYSSLQLHLYYIHTIFECIPYSTCILVVLCLLCPNYLPIEISYLMGILNTSNTFRQWHQMRMMVF